MSGTSRRHRLKNLRNRYGRDFCYICRNESKFMTTTDHVIPMSKGGKRDWSNTMLACYPCNQAKGDEDSPRYRALAAMARGSRELLG